MPTSSLNVNAKAFEPRVPMSAPVDIPLPEDPWAQTEEQISTGLSPEDAAELDEVQGWLELMAELEQSESDHLIAMAMRYADKSHIAAVKNLAARQQGPSSEKRK